MLAQSELASRSPCSGLASLVVLLLLLVFPAVHEPQALQGKLPTLLLGIDIPRASDVSEEMCSQIRAGLRQDMVAALKPNSVVWKGALDGYMVAQELREEAKAKAAGVQGKQVGARGAQGARSTPAFAPVRQNTSISPDRF